MLPWIFLLFSLLAWWVVFTTASMLELGLALAAAVVFLVLGFFGLLAARVGAVTQTQRAREKALLLASRPKPPPAVPGREAGASAAGPTNPPVAAPDDTPARDRS